MEATSYEMYLQNDKIPANSIKMFFENKGEINKFRIQKLNLSPADIYKRRY